MTHRIPKPSWRFDFSADHTLRAVPYFEEVDNGLTKHMWEVEENVLTSAVVDLLRSKGYTVIEPNPPGTRPTYDC